MRFIARLLMCAGVAVAVAGCSNADKHYFKEGVGANLYAESAIPIAEDATNRTDLQKTYVKEICLQAGLYEIDCGTHVTDPTVWNAFVQAGMNDIDQRCDAYLTWLDNYRRAQPHTLKEFGDAQTATTIIMQQAGVAAAPIAIAAAAFGFATSTFANVSGRLVLEVDRSTVQQLVLSRQRKYREELFGSLSKPSSIAIPNRPMAIFALRSYLRLCMPMTIETEINTLISTFERGGANALANGTPMISAKSIGVAMRADEKVRNPGRQSGPANASFAKLFEHYTPQQYPDPYVVEIQRALCVPDKELGKGGVITENMIRISEQALQQKPNGKLDGSDATKILMPDGPTIPCTKDGARNYFERTTYTDSAKLLTLIKRLNATTGGTPLAETATLKDARGKILEARKAKATQLDLSLPNDLADQMTRDLEKKLDFPKP